MLKFVLYLLFLCQITKSEGVPLVFYVDNRFLYTQSRQEIVNNLSNYIIHLNKILAKTTNKHFTFEKLVFKKHGLRISSNYSTYFPTDHYELWVDIDKSEYPFSYGGYFSYNTGGEAVLAGLSWCKFYDKPKNNYETRDYWGQITVLLHEYAHVFGAGIGEYYSLINIPDRTGELSIHNLDITDQSDAFWKNKRDFINDPLMWNVYNRPLLGFPTNINQLLEKTCYSQITSFFINGNYRYPVINPRLPTKVRFLVIGDRGQQLEDVKIEIWKMSYFQDTIDKIIGHDSIDYEWDVNSISIDNLRFAKVYKEGYEPQSLYFSVYDIQWAFFTGRDKLVILTKMNKVS